MTYRPTVSLPAAFRVPRSNPRSVPLSPVLGEERDKAKKVNKLIVDGPDFMFGIWNNTERVFPIGGDHLYVDELIGSMPCSVRLDSRDQPPVRLEEGMVLRRPFDRFLVRFDVPMSQDDRDVPIRTPSTRVVLYVTYGPFIIEKPPKPYGAHPGFASRFDCDASIVPKIFFIDMMDEFTAFGADPEDLFGQGGATVILTNDDALNDLYIKYTDQNDLPPAKAALARNWFPLRAGQSISMTVESLIRREVTPFSINGLYVATLSGTCKYSFIISRSPVFGPGVTFGDSQNPL